MLRFIIRSIVFFVAIIAVFAIMTASMKMDTRNNLCMLNIKDSLMMSTPSPRYVFVSGSSLAFGLDSKMLKDSLNVNVVNTALQAGLGMKYILESNIPYIKSGDTVVVAAEYEHFDNLMNGNLANLGPAMYYTKFRNIDKLNLQQLLLVFAGYPTALRMNMKSFKNSEKFVTYTVRGYNEYGDEESHRTNDPYSQDFLPLNPDMHLQKDTYGEVVVRNLNKIREKGAEVIVIPPPIREGAFNKRMSKEVADYLKENGFPMLVDCEEHLFPDSLMYDSNYHLSGKGVEIFTKKLIKELKQHRNAQYHNNKL